MKTNRKIKILLDQRSVKDSPELLENIAKIFICEEITIKLVHSKKGESQIIRDRELEYEIAGSVREKLNEINEEKSTKVQNSEGESISLKKKVTKYLEKLGNEGVKVTVTSLIKNAIALLFK